MIGRWSLTARRTIAQAIPAALRPDAWKLWSAFRLSGPAGLASAIDELLGVWRPSTRSIHYKGFTLFFGRGSVIIPDVAGGRTWEKLVSERIVDALARCLGGVFVDVGANLGLTTLNVLAALPSTRVFAFEPGFRQAELLSKTISANGLTRQVTSYRVALGETAGTRLFAVHDRRFDAFDGFVDTGRAPLRRIVKVETQTLDGWWHAAHCPPVGVIKLDTEGSELWILRGAVELVARLQPIIVLEIQPANLHHY